MTSPKCSVLRLERVGELFLIPALNPMIESFTFVIQKRLLGLRERADKTINKKTQQSAVR